MAHLEIRIVIAAPRQVVWRLLADLENQAAWMVDVRRLYVVTEDKQGVGAVMQVTSELFGLPVIKDIMEITVWEPPYRMEVEHRGQFHGTGKFILEDTECSTRLTWTEDFEPPLGSVGEAAFALFVRPHLKRVFARSLAKLRRLAEASVPTQ